MRAADWSSVAGLTADDTREGVLDGEVAAGAAVATAALVVTADEARDGVADGAFAADGGGG